MKIHVDIKGKLCHNVHVTSYFSVHTIRFLFSKTTRGWRQFYERSLSHESENRPPA